MVGLKKKMPSDTSIRLFLEHLLFACICFDVQYGCFNSILICLFCPFPSTSDFPGNRHIIQMQYKIQENQSVNIFRKFLSFRAKYLQTL